MNLEVQVPDTSVYYDLFKDLGLKPDSDKRHFSNYKFFSIDVKNKYFGGNLVSHSEFQKCSIKEAIEFCVTGKLPQSKLHTFDELKSGDKFIYVDDSSCSVHEKMAAYEPSIQRIIKMYNGKYSIVTNSRWIETKCLKKVGE